MEAHSAQTSKESPAGSHHHAARLGVAKRGGDQKIKGKPAKLQAPNAQFAAWETFVGILSISDGARVLNVSWRCYRNYRTASSLPLMTRYAMQAIAHKLPAWGDE